MCVHMYVRMSLVQCWHERIRTCTYVYVRMNIVIQCGYTAATNHTSLFVQTCAETYACMYIRMFVPCTYMHLLYTSLRSRRASYEAPGKPKKAIQLVC